MPAKHDPDVTAPAMQVVRDQRHRDSPGPGHARTVAAVDHAVIPPAGALKLLDPPDVVLGGDRADHAAQPHRPGQGAEQRA